ncbi:signal recognition particle-docking protein FtsY [Halovenus sp. HT40]|uniref:signal recognition particle-docking protein FtsY n=1 Tax=Halovenus sp. HT40 TaxID=3126691 RepID=UPI00300F68E6
MFDGLKDKLKGFTEDVEDEAELDEAEAEADAEAEAAQSGSASDEEETGEQTAASADPVEQDGTDSAPTAAEPDSDTAVDTEESAPDEETDSTEQEPADSEGGGLGLTGKAKALATGKTIIEQEELQPHLDELEVALLDSNVELEVTIEILNGIEENLAGEARGRLESTGSVVEDALREALYDVINVGQFDFDQRIAEADKPFVMVFTGVNGVGKTTSIAKLSKYLEDQGYSTVLANGDTYRAGANEQLQEHADALDRKLITHEQGSDPAAVIYDAVEYAEANDVDVVLGDTAGRLHTSDDLMDQLEKIDRVIEPDMTVFVDEAVAGQDAVNRADEFDKAATIDASILTKADADQDGGAAISVAHVTGKPILFLGTGQDYDDLERFDPERIVNELLGPE